MLRSDFFCFHALRLWCRLLFRFSFRSLFLTWTRLRLIYYDLYRQHIFKWARTFAGRKTFPFNMYPRLITLAIFPTSFPSPSTSEATSWNGGDGSPSVAIGVNPCRPIVRNKICSTIFNPSCKFLCSVTSTSSFWFWSLVSRGGTGGHDSNASVRVSIVSIRSAEKRWIV